MFVKAYNETREHGGYIQQGFIAGIIASVSTKQRTISLTAIAMGAVLVLFASGPLVTTHQAHACWGGGCCGGCGCGGSGGGWGW